MSVHAMIAAAYVEDVTPASTKLVLMAIADSSDEHTLEAAPGLPKLRAWSGLGKSQTLAVVKALVDAGYLERLEAGRLGRRAVYRVFPNGIPAIPHPTEVAARFEPSTPEENPVDNPPIEGPAHRTLGSDSTPSRVRPTGPLHFNPSVSTRERTDPAPVETRRPAPPAPGFPGARTAAETADPRTRRGFHDLPCPNHPDDTVPCGRCAHAAAEARRLDPDHVTRTTTLIRAQLRANRTVPQEDTSE